ncbi:ATPase [Xanthomonas oryzae]|uniref:ATPase n=1 Tax=Xanthomonas oryzae TaxID=347 RepID=A0AAP0ZIJ2_9XANT|nr:SRPBCC domain-containing protein [Xanthomonas oryzae]KOR40668.1 ATPase [Xanthomonas oryzae]QBG85375.1 SRPBCC domain-containing protein [Xanthomonas oryzae]
MNCEIRHSTVIAAAPEVVSAALSEPRQLAHWRTREVRLADDLVRLYWSRQGWRVELSIDAGANHQLVCWRCHDSNMRDTDAWKGNVMRFELRPTSQGTQIDFVQSGYRDSPCKEACARGWRFFLGSRLKRYVETGEGAPSADMGMPESLEQHPHSAR